MARRGNLQHSYRTVVAVGRKAGKINGRTAAKEIINKPRNTSLSPHEKYDPSFLQDQNKIDNIQLESMCPLVKVEMMVRFTLPSG